MDRTVRPFRNTQLTQLSALYSTHIYILLTCVSIYPPEEAGGRSIMCDITLNSECHGFKSLPGNNLRIFMANYELHFENNAFLPHPYQLIIH